MNLHQWVIRHGVSMQALVDLQREIGMINTDPDTSAVGASETSVQASVRLEASRKGGRLFRNNVGVLMDLDGRPVRFGLANDSKQLNEKIKSGDLIGIQPVMITGDHVGQTIGQFVSREIKTSNWRYVGTAHEVAQLNWINLINSLGGDAAFATGVGTL